MMLSPHLSEDTHTVRPNHCLDTAPTFSLRGPGTLTSPSEDEVGIAILTSLLFQGHRKGSSQLHTVHTAQLQQEQSIWLVCL